MASRVNRVASGNNCKATGTSLGLTAAGETNTDVTKCRVELQDRPGLRVNAQPIGYEQTLAYAQARMDTMIAEFGPNPEGYDFSVESGAIRLGRDGTVIPDNTDSDEKLVDVAIVLIRNRNGREYTGVSAGVPFPEGTLEEAIRRGVKTTTAGDVIAERFPGVPSGTWQEHFGGLSRERQIADAVETGIIALRVQG